MCIGTSCTSRLNPGAREFKPAQLRHRIPLHHAPSPLPPTLTAAPVATFPGHHPQKLLCHLPRQLMHFHMGYPTYVPRAHTDAVYHSPPPYPLPATGYPCAAAAPLSGCEVKVLEKCAVKGASKMCRSPTVSPPPRLRLEWKPKKTAADDGTTASPPPGVVIRGRTTVMVRNIPNQLRREYMLEFLDSYCSEHLLNYDFMYLPMDFRSKDNLGYAFVNFTSGGDASKFKKILHNYKWGTVETNRGLYTSKKICAITWAKYQGKDKLVKRFEDSVFRCDDPEFLPVVFDPPRSGGSNTSSPVVVGRLMNVGS